MQNASRVRSALNLASSPVTVFVVALSARLGVLRQLLPAKTWSGFYEHNEFARIAWALASGYGYSSPWAHTPLAPTAVEPPIYSYLLAGIFRLAGSYSYASLWIAVTFNAVLSALTAVLVLHIGKRDFGAPTGVLAAWVWSCWLYEAVVSVHLWESSLSALFLATALLILPILVESPRWSRWLIFGLLAGIAALTNTTLLSLFPFFWLWLWILYRRRGRSCSKVLLASIGVCILTLLPWTIRNYEIFHNLMPMRDNFGLELWIGNHAGAMQSDQFPSDFPLLDPSEYNRLGEIRFMEVKRQIALQFIWQNPAQFLRLSARRCWRFWTTPEGSPWLWISLLAWLGLMLALGRLGANALPSAVVMLVFPLVYCVTHTFPSYRHPIEPVVLLLASYAAIGVLHAAGARRSGRRGTAGIQQDAPSPSQTLR
jgi:4-amino-4-deoxy-L-arabinose transferase-like glycosyltransferase